MLPKKARLTAVEVRHVLKAGRTARAGALSAKFIPGASAKAAVVVSTKVSKSAVARNALRREAYQALQSALPERVHAVLFLHKPLIDPRELTELCSKLS
jgi:ribonuclease P protein component